MASRWQSWDLNLTRRNSSSSSSRLPQRTSLVAQLIKNLPAMRETLVDSWVRKICWRRDRLPTPVFLGFHGGSADKRIHPQCRTPGFNPWVGKIPWRRERLQYSSLRIPWSHKESGTTERLSLRSSRILGFNLYTDSSQ